MGANGALTIALAPPPPMPVCVALANVGNKWMRNDDVYDILADPAR